MGQEGTRREWDWDEDEVKREGSYCCCASEGWPPVETALGRLVSSPRWFALQQSDELEHVGVRNLLELLRAVKSFFGTCQRCRSCLVGRGSSAILEKSKRIPPCIFQLSCGIFMVKYHEGLNETSCANFTNTRFLFSIDEVKDIHIMKLTQGPLTILPREGKAKGCVATLIFRRIFVPDSKYSRIDRQCGSGWS